MSLTRRPPAETLAATTPASLSAGGALVGSVLASTASPVRRACYARKSIHLSRSPVDCPAAPGRRERAGTPTSTAFHHGQLFDRPEARPLAPADLVGRHRQAQSWPTGEQRLKGAHAFDARKLMAKAEMNPSPKGDVPVRSSLEVEPLGMLVRLDIHIGRRHHGHDPVTLLQPNPAKLHVLSHEPRLRKLHRRDEAQEFLDRETNPTPILLEPIS